VKLKDIIWSAGFLEGDGGFYFTTTAVVSAGQDQLWPLEELKRIYGGSIVYSEHSQWHIYGYEAAAIMMTLYDLVSPNRQEQIRYALNQWMKMNIANKLKERCPRGHLYTVTTNRRVNRRICRTCTRAQFKFV